MAEQRKLVSVLFADVVGSTAFGSDHDPEVVRSVMGSYFERMKQVAERHGGTTEKFIGDAVMVVFGVPVLHDDDAERAVRAGLAMRDAMAELNADLRVALAARVGVNTGEAVTGGTGEERQFLVTGDAVNVAARLQQGAEVGEVVVGGLTESLTRAAIEYDERAPVLAKGKAEPIMAFRAIRARSAVPEQARGLPAMRAQLVGRQRELRLLLDTFERVREERRAHVFTLVGNAGIGKSRLVGEALARIAASSSARVLRGRCLPYGAAITYWPLMEIVRDDAGIAADDDRDAAIEKLGRRVEETVGAPDADAVRERLAVLLGLRGAEDGLPGTGGADVAREIAWGARRYLAAIATEPAVIVVDDLQWAEPAVFEIIDGLAEHAQDAPLLLLCIARPELLDLRADWGAGRSNSSTISLDALTRDETATLISRLLDVDDLPAELRARVVERAEGNPLFCEEFLRMLIDEGRVERVGDRWRATTAAGDVRVPESIHALIAARLDGLLVAERRALEVASVVGERFGEAEVRALEPSIESATFAALRRKGLVLEDREARERGRYRFKHLLIRDVAYSSLPKAARAELHERFGDELERQVGDRRDEFAEILAYHAERSFTLAAELRLPRTTVEPRARRALTWALRLGERARARDDARLLAPFARLAAAALAALAGSATVEDELDVALLLADERHFAGAYDEALAAYEEAAAKAREAGATHHAARAHHGASRVLMLATSEEQLPAWIGHTEAARELFRESGDAGGEIEAGLIALEMHWGRGELEQMLRRGAELLARARDIVDPVRELLLVARLAGAAGNSGRSALSDEYWNASQDIVARLGLRQPPWMRGDACRRIYFGGDADGSIACFLALADAGAEEGYSPLVIGAFRNAADVMFGAGRQTEARPLLERALAESIHTGERWNRAELHAALARVAAVEGDVAAAEKRLADARAALRPSDIAAVAEVALATAAVRHAQGREAEADAAFHEAIGLLAATEFSVNTGGFYVVYAEYLVAVGRHADARHALEEAERRLGDRVKPRVQRIAELRQQLAARR